MLNKEYSCSPDESEGGGVEVGGRHEGVEDSPCQGLAGGEGKRLVQLHIVQVELVVIQKPHIRRERQVDDDGHGALPPTVRGIIQQVTQNGVLRSTKKVQGGSEITLHCK